MYAKVESLGLNGLDAFSVTVEADISTDPVKDRPYRLIAGAV